MGRWIAWQLEGASYTTIIRAWDIRPGSNFVVEMDEAANCELIQPREQGASLQQARSQSEKRDDPLLCARTQTLHQNTDTPAFIEEAVLLNPQRDETR